MRFWHASRIIRVAGINAATMCEWDAISHMRCRSVTRSIQSHGHGLSRLLLYHGDHPDTGDFPVWRKVCTEIDQLDSILGMLLA